MVRVAAGPRGHGAVALFIGEHAATFWILLLPLAPIERLDHHGFNRPGRVNPW
jgi:hypothetical protein